MSQAPVVQTVAWERLALWPGHPRHRVDEGRLRELAESIAVNGVLQNLIVRPIPPDDPYVTNLVDLEVVTGQRRWRAIDRLVQSGRARPDFPVPVRVLPLSDHEALLRLVVAENVDREDLAPLEEAAVFQRLVVHFVRAQIRSLRAQRRARLLNLGLSAALLASLGVIAFAAHQAPPGWFPL